MLQKKYTDSLTAADRGKKAEVVVTQYLENRGYQILKQRYRITCGEIDIIAQKGSLLLFVEVKQRSYAMHDFESANLIDSQKQKRIALAAHHFIARHQCTETAFRFDVAFVTGQSFTDIHYIENAFQGE